MFASKEDLTLKLSSGVMILSKYPLELIKHVVFNVSKKVTEEHKRVVVLVEINVNDKKVFLQELI